jgi:hypothetical protein
VVHQDHTAAIVLATRRAPTNPRQANRAASSPRPVPAERPAEMATEDVLFDARNNFTIGHFQSAIAEANNAKAASEATRAERDVLMYRAYIEQGNSTIVMNEVNASAPPALRAVRLLAAYKGGNEAGKQAAVAGLQELLGEAGAVSNPLLCVVAASVFCGEKDYKEVLKANQQAQTLEQHAVVTHAYVCMNRIDLAEKQVHVMLCYVMVPLQHTRQHRRR